MVIPILSIKTSRMPDIAGFIKSMEEMGATVSKAGNTIKIVIGTGGKDVSGKNN